jgi:hypothetical protein
LYMKHLLHIVLIYALGSLVSCKNDKIGSETGTTPLNPKVEMLSGTNQKLWGFTSATKNGVETLADCQKDNLILYKVNMTVIVDEGALKCVASAPQSTTSAWNFNKTEDSIVYITGGVEAGYKIDFLSADELKLSVTDTVPGTDSFYVYRVSFKPQ